MLWQKNRPPQIHVEHMVKALFSRFWNITAHAQRNSRIVDPDICAHIEQGLLKATACGLLLERCRAEYILRVVLCV